MSSAQYLSIWSQSPPLPLIETRPSSRNTLIFIGGLTDTLGTVPYLPTLAEAIAPFDYSIVQPQLSSSLGGYGLSSLEADAQEICLVIQYLQNRAVNPKPRDGRIVLMGHSTGCQDVVHVLSHDRTGIRIDGAILQAPVSDREAFEGDNPEGSPAHLLLKEAITLVEQGKGSTLLPRDASASPRAPCSSRWKVNGDAFQNPAMTAYRFWSLYANGGDDDYFSSDLSTEKMTEIWRDTLHRGNRVLAILGEKDESYPSHVSPQQLARQWNEVASKVIEESNWFDAIVLSDANHKVDSSKAQAVLISNVTTLLEKLQSDYNEQELESQSIAAPSFDEVVELISTGKAENIPGVKSIPLKINQAIPSASHMQRPAKPWEAAASTHVETQHNI